MAIGGNTEAVIQVSSVTANDYGNEVTGWKDAFDRPVVGFLDLAGEGTNSKSLLRRVEEADYVFICDYFEPVSGGIRLTAENSRIVIDREIYEVKMYDDPMRLHEHMEIYLKYVGGQ